MKIAIIGSINLDITIKAHKIPLKGETVEGNDLIHMPGGKGANQAVALSRLGALVTMFGCVGDDLYGENLIYSLKNENVDTSYIKKIDDTSTGVALITIAENDNTIVISPGANACVNIDYVNQFKNEILSNDMILLQHEIPQDTIEYIVDICYNSGVKVLLNPAPARKVTADTLKKISYITPNEHEAAIIFGENTLTSLKKMPEKLIITLGSKGVCTSLLNGDILNVAARPAKVLDTTGAGDTLNAAFAFAILKYKDIKYALKFANCAASLSTEKFGAQGGMPTFNEVVDNLLDM